MAGTIDPWSSQDIDDYERLIQEFGMEDFDARGLEDAPPVMRRGYVVGQRGFDYIRRAIQKGEKYAMLTGLMPSGRAHFGHKMVIDEILYYQRMGGDVFVAVADIESYATRNVPPKKAYQIAVEEYIKTYIALGLKPEGCQIYLQSKREEVKDLAYLLGKKVNWSTMRSIYGFTEETNMAHVFSPLVQVGDILHVQLEKFGGPRPTIVPVGLDQDPHIRFTRDVAAASRIYSIQRTGEGFGIFLKGEWMDEKAAKMLAKAKEVMKGKGYKDFETNIPYGALYVKDGYEDLNNLLHSLAPIEIEEGGFGFFPPSATYHRFMKGITGGKMSSSREESAIFLSDNVDISLGKMNKAFTGGRTTAAEQREQGGDPDICTVYEMMRNHLVEDDKELESIKNSCLGGAILCGECKSIAKERLREFLEEFQAKKAAISPEQVDQYLAKDTLD